MGAEKIVEIVEKKSAIITLCRASTALHGHVCNLRAIDARAAVAANAINLLSGRIDDRKPQGLG